MTARLIYGEEERLLPWAQARVGVEFRRDAYSIGLERDGQLVAVVVFDTFSSSDCHIHIASDGSRAWMSKSLLLATFAYPFDQLGLRRVTGMVPAKNADALAFDKHLGFVEEGRHPHALPDDDVISLGLTRERCRFVAHPQRSAA